MSHRATILIAAAALAHGIARANGPDFNSEVRPLLETACLSCHNPEKMKGDLLMGTLAELLEGGESGPSLVPGKADESPLVTRVTLPHDDDDIMPPKGDPLTAEQQAVLRDWVNAGATWPEHIVLVPKTSEEVATLAAASAKAADGGLESLQFFPDAVQLETARDFHQVSALATFKDGTTADVTDISNLRVEGGPHARLLGDVLHPASDGDCQLVATFGGTTIKAPVKVTGASEDRPVSFNLDVMPIFMREGCNSGGCHGSARGQDRFRLSLFGFDAPGDYHRLTREMAGRRLNLARPEQSFLLLKSTEAVPHSGGKLFEPGSTSYDTLHEWISNGAPKDPEEIAHPVGMDIYPTKAVMEGIGATQQITVRARYSDGTDRDVTELCVFSSNNDPVAPVTRAGQVTASGRGEAFIMARFHTFTEGAQILALPADIPYQKPDAPSHNYIDELVNAKLHRLRVLPSETCDDLTFVRRVYADIVGLLPDPAEVEGFMADGAADKRSKLIDTLLARDEFTDMWVMKWAELLQIHTSGNDRRYNKNVALYHAWLRENIAANRPIDEIIMDLLTATGGNFENPATNYYEMERDTLKITENAVQVFMGIRVQCAQCHNHPFDRWTMDDYYGFASFFSQIGRKRGDDARQQYVYDRRSGDAKNPVTGQTMAPTFLGGETPEIPSGTDRREVLAHWLASEDNPYFAPNLANIIWHHFTGVGIIDPVDDVRVSNPASNPELLSALGDKLTEYGYDFRALVRDICNSAAYQRSTRPNATNEADSRNYARAQVRRFRAEILLDAIAQVTESPDKYRGLPLGARAVEIADGSTSNYFLTAFGRAQRTSVCSCEVQVDPNLSQALHLINGESVHRKVLAGGLIPRLIQDGLDDKAIVHELYSRSFSREPSAPEIEVIESALASGGPEQRQPILEDLFWALLNSKEFIFNH